MAGTTTALIGQDVSMSINSVIIGCARQLDYELSVGMVDVSCASSGDNKEQKPGQLSWKGSLSGVTRITTGDDIATNQTSYELFNAIKNRTLLTLVWIEDNGLGVTHEYSGSGYASSLKKTAAPIAGGEATFSCDFEGTGALNVQIVD